MEAGWMNFSFRPSISHSECGQIRWPCSVAPPFRTYFWATTWSFRMERNKAKCGKEFHASHSCTLPPKHLDVLRKGPRLTIGVPTIIKDYDCSSWLNGKPPAKSRETKIWLIMVHSVNNFVRSELPALKSDMAAKEIGKRRKKWRKFRTTDVNKQEYDPIRTSNSNMHEIWWWFFEFGSNRSSSKNHTVQSWHCVRISFVMVWTDFRFFVVLHSTSHVPHIMEPARS